MKEKQMNIIGEWTIRNEGKKGDGERKKEKDVISQLKRVKGRWRRIKKKKKMSEDTTGE